MRLLQRRLFVVDNGLTIDLSSMKGIAVNAEAKLAVVQGKHCHGWVLQWVLLRPACWAPDKKQLKITPDQVADMQS